jgi:hypothetical protein
MILTMSNGSNCKINPVPVNLSLKKFLHGHAEERKLAFTVRGRLSEPPLPCLKKKTPSYTTI